MSILPIKWPQKVLFINNKGWVWKTTLSYNVSCHLAKQWYKVLMVDWDPQANLTLLALGVQKYEELWFFEANSIYHVVKKLINRTGDIDESIQPTTMWVWGLPAYDGRLSLLPWSLLFGDFDDILSTGFTEATGGGIWWFTVVSGLNRYLTNLHYKHRYDFIIIDASPSLTGALNKMLFLMSHFFIAISTPDIFSLQGIQHLGTKGKRRRDDWEGTFQQARRAQIPTNLVLEWDPTFLGYIANQFNVYDHRPIHSHNDMLKNIGTAIKENLSEKHWRNWLVAVSYSNPIWQTQDYGTICADAQKKHKPIFELTDQDFEQAEWTVNVYQKAVAELEFLWNNVAERVSMWAK